jgi:hypothetical protein
VERPYKHFLADDLLALAKDSRRHAELLAILQEFQFRSTARAAAVRSQVVDLLWRQIEESFRFPTSDAPGGDGSLSQQAVFKHPTGLLGYLGYQVGLTGLVRESRKEILDRVYQDALPLVNSPQYMSEWGTPYSGPRLHKMADSVATFCRNAKRNDPDRLAIAIDDWEEDLAYLKRSYYDGRYDFYWPSTD